MELREQPLVSVNTEYLKSSHDTSVLLQNVASQVNCAMTYISNFVDSSAPASNAANLSDKEKGIISDAVNTINNWNTLCDQGISIAMSSDPDIISIKSSSQQLKQHTQQLSNATSLLKSKLLVFNIHQ